jgi:hypothetical protein
MTAFWDIAPCSIVEQTNISEVRTASIIKVMKSRSTSTRLHGGISQKAVIFKPILVYLTYIHGWFDSSSALTTTCLRYFNM